MKRILFVFIWVITVRAFAQTYTEFYVQTTGDNLNAGSTTDDTAPHTYAGGTFVRATGVFTVASGDPSADGVVSNEWASIYTTAGATVATCMGRITNVDTTTITIDRATVSGLVSTVSEGAGEATCKVGGAWKGPNGTAGFPFGFIATNSVTTNVALAGAQLWPRCNIKSNALYSVTQAMTHNLAGPTRFEGYLTTPGDGGRANIDGGAAGASYTVLTMGSASSDCALANLIFSNNGNSGIADYLIRIQGARTTVYRVTVHDSWRQGMNGSGNGMQFIECEAYACNKNNNSSSSGGFQMQALTILIRCMSYSNTTANADGFVFDATGGTMINCIAARNGRNGVRGAGSPLSFFSSDFYGNNGSGIDYTFTTIGYLMAQNCNFILNGAYGITSSGTTLRNGSIINCAFGSGDKANTSGDIANNLGATYVLGSVTYAANAQPWTDPVNGDFRIALTAAKSAGRGSFIETGGYSGVTVGYPDIGAAQSSSTNAASASGGSWTFAQ